MIAGETYSSMKEEGLLRQHARMGTQFLDVVAAALLRQDWTDTPRGWPGTDPAPWTGIP